MCLSTPDKILILRPLHQEAKEYRAPAVSPCKQYGFLRVHISGVVV